VITHTCDECGRVPEYRINRHHEHRDPDVILMLCPDCHNRLHRVRGVPGRARFDATLGLTLAEAGAVVVVAGVDGVDEHEIRRRMPLDRIMARIDHMDRARARLSA
jgi:hypothetical protein